MIVLGNCFLCLETCANSSMSILPRHADGPLYAGEKACAQCTQLIKTSVAIISVSDKSYLLQNKAITSFLHRKATGQTTPFPNLYKRTGLTLFVKPIFVEEFFKKSLNEENYAKVEGLIKATIEVGWVCFADSTFETEGLAAMMDPEVVSFWVELRKQVDNE